MGIGDGRGYRVDRLEAYARFMAHQVYPGGRRRVRIVQLARDLVTGEWQRSHGRAGGLAMSASSVQRYRDLLVQLDVIRPVPMGRRGTNPTGSRCGDRYTYGRQFWAWFGQGRFSRVGMRIRLVRAALVRVFGVQSVPMTSFVLTDSLVSSHRDVEKVPAAPANDRLPPPPDVGGRTPRWTRAQGQPQTINREEDRGGAWPNPAQNRRAAPKCTDG